MSDQSNQSSQNLSADLKEQKRLLLESISDLKTEVDHYQEQIIDLIIAMNELKLAKAHVHKDLVRLQKELRTLNNQIENDKHV